MNKISLTQFHNVISHYLNGIDNRPYFVLVDDDKTYNEIVSIVGGNKVKTSNYCKQDDSFPDIDWLRTDLEKLPKGSTNILLGFGEALHLQFSPKSDTFSFSNFKIRKVSLLKDLYFPGKVVVLCKFLYSEIQEITRNDFKFTTERYCYIPPEDEFIPCKIIQTSIDLNCSTLKGFKDLLRKLEDGNNDNKELYVLSNSSLHNVTKINTIFEAIQIEDPHFDGKQSWLTDQQWEEYRADKKLQNDNILHWRTFLDLKLNGASGTNKEYKTYVANQSSTYSEYKNKVFSALLDFSPNDNDFEIMYAQRKQWIKGVTESNLSAFIYNDLICKDDQFQIYYLTDNTSAERQAILKWLSQNELTPEVRCKLKTIYPDLYWYLSTYHFKITNINDKINNEFDEYFQKYRLQKVVNRLTVEFLELVNSYSLSRPYNFIPQTRGAVLERFQPEKTFLYWLDALGVEYLPFIQNWAQNHGLNMKTDIVKTILPTITSKNKEFYDEWQENMKKANKTLDKVKHEGINGTKEAQYLEKELEIIKSALEEILSLLYQSQSQIASVVLVSDHGASRLAVLSGQENRWEMQNKGKHSGRCCPISEMDQSPDCATKENDFWVIANYQRFRGGRKADIEVHGGATLEEVVIPVIEFSLKNSKTVKVKEPTTIKVKSDKTAVLYVVCSSPLENAWVKWNDRSYPIQQQDETTYYVTFQNVNAKAGDQKADVYENDTYLNPISFTLEKGFGKAHSIEDMFD